MGLQLIRVDDRLIHGQVALGWSRARGIDTIIAVDDKVAKDSFQCSLLKMATPAGVKSFILDEDHAEENIKSGKYDRKKVMLLVKGPRTLLNLLNRGIEIKEVNIGNLCSAAGKEKLLSHVYADEEELKLWKEISGRGVKMYAQTVPDSSSADFNEVLRKL